jgi:uncharacterized protein (DUF1778 family)
MPKLPYSSAARMRTKILNFRLSEPEYDRIVAAAEVSGQSVSDFARAAMLGTPDQVYASAPEFSERLSRVEQKLNVVLEILDGLGNGSKASEGINGNKSV